MEQVKKISEISRKKRMIAAVCAAVIMAGGSAGIYAFSAGEDKKPESDDSKQESAKKADDGIMGFGVVFCPIKDRMLPLLQSGRL